VPSLKNGTRQSQHDRQEEEAMAEEGSRKRGQAAAAEQKQRCAGAGERSEQKAVSQQKDTGRRNNGSRKMLKESPTLNSNKYSKEQL